jgi:hypothetical protein
MATSSNRATRRKRRFQGRNSRSMALPEVPMSCRGQLAAHLGMYVCVCGVDGCLSTRNCWVCRQCPRRVHATVLPIFSYRPPRFHLNGEKECPAREVGVRAGQHTGCTGVCRTRPVLARWAGGSEVRRAQARALMRPARQNGRAQGAMCAHPGRCAHG